MISDKTDKFPLGKEIPYDTLVDESIAGLLYLENDKIVFCNNAFAGVLSANISDVIGSSILDWLTRSDRVIVSDYLERMLAGETNEFSSNLRLDAEEVVYFSLHLRVMNRTDSVIELTGASRNSTARVKRSIELNKEQSRYNALFENSVACIMIYNYDQEKIVECNKAAIKTMEYSSKEELLGKSRLEFVPATSDFFPGLDMHRLTKKHGEQIMKGVAFNTPGAFLTKSGEEFLVQASVTPTFYEYGEGFIIFHDVTNEVLSENALEKSEKEYKTIFENSHEAVIYIDIKNDDTILCNDNAYILFDVEDLNGIRKLKPKDYIYDKYDKGINPNEIMRSGYTEAMEKGRAKIGFWSKRRDGTEVRIEGMLINDSSNKDEPRVIAFLRDVTFMHNAKISLNEKNEQLKKYIDSNMQLENFAYLASHDLQTPLRSIISFTQLLGKRLGDKLNEEELEYLDYIIQSGKNMRLLINDLLSYSRINTTKIHPVKIKLRDLLFQVCKDLSSDIKESEAYIDIQEVPDEITADVTKIKQIFQNLLMNAIKFRKKDEPPYIKISCEQDKDHWQFSIEDNGIGIEPEYQEKIFLLFKRLHVITKYEGTGIGLAMVKKLVEQHEGKIWLTSDLNQGATFNFTIKKEITIQNN